MKGDDVKFKVEREVLEDYVTWAARTLPTHPASAVLSGIRMKAENDSVTIDSFDFEISSTSTFAAQVEEPGEVLVSGRLLADICKSLPHKPVTVEQEGAKVNVTCGSAHFALMTMPLENYPELPQFPAVSGKLDDRLFAKAVSQVAIAASADPTLPLLSTIRLEVTGELITFMSTDRYRLAVRKMPWEPLDSSIETAVLIKAKTLQDMSKSLGGGSSIDLALPSGDVEPGMMHSRIVGFEAEGRRMTSQLSDGDYPPVARLFPETTEYSALVDRQALLETVRRVSLVIQKTMQLRMSFSDGVLRLEGGDGDDAHAVEEIQCIFDGDELLTAFNPPYLMDVLNALDTTYVRFAFTHPSKPAVITGQDDPTGEEDDSFRYLLMPIRYDR